MHRENDEQFLTRLIGSPKEAIEEVGLSLTDEESAAFREVRVEEWRAFMMEYRCADRAPPQSVRF